MSTNTQKPASRKFAKSVIEIWLWGGPCQLETFDPKPDAPHDYNNGLKSIKSASGFELHEWLPELAKCSDLYSIIRSMTQLIKLSILLEPVAAAIPTKTAMTALITDAIRPTVILTDRPFSVRKNRSRPNASVPKK